MTNRVLYFGHPVNVYGTALESRLIAAIVASTEFLGWGLENPAAPEHAQAYEALVAAGKRGMDHFFQTVLPRCHGGVFLPFRDGFWGRGVYGEMAWFAERGLPIWSISPEGIVDRLPRLPDASLALDVEATRARIRRPDGSTLPY